MKWQPRPMLGYPAEYGRFWPPFSIRPATTGRKGAMISKKNISNAVGGPITSGDSNPGDICAGCRCSCARTVRRLPYRDAKWQQNDFHAKLMPRAVSGACRRNRIHGVRRCMCGCGPEADFTRETCKHSLFISDRRCWRDFRRVRGAPATTSLERTA